MLTLDNERVGEREMPMQENSLIRCELKDEVDNFALRIDVVHREHEMFEVAQF
jgi:hypothetical protein